MYMHLVCKSLSSNQSVSVRHVVDMHAFHCCVFAEIPRFLLHDADSSVPAAPQRRPFMDIPLQQLQCLPLSEGAGLRFPTQHYFCASCWWKTSQLVSSLWECVKPRLRSSAMQAALRKATT